MIGVKDSSTKLCSPEVEDQGRPPASPKDIRFHWEEFVAGLGAGIVSVTCVYPIHKIMFRQMRHGVPTSRAVEQLKTEGFKLLYRGLLPPLCQKGVSCSIMYGAYKNYGDYIMNTFPNVNPQFAKSVGAGLAGVSEAFLTTPFERIQTLLQDEHYNTKLNNTYHTVRHLWRNHGLREYYRGMSMIVLRNSVANMMYFASLEKVVSVIPKPTNAWSKYIADFVSGGLVGAAVSTFFYPTNVIKTRMQCRLGGAFESPRYVLTTVFSERGQKVSEMFRGIHLNYARSLLSWGIIYASYELIRRNLYKYSGNEQ